MRRFQKSFYSRLCKWDEHFDGLPVHTVPVFLYYFLSFHSLQPVTEFERIVVDISDTLDQKMEAVASYKTQFPPSKARFFPSAIRMRPRVTANLEAQR